MLPTPPAVPPKAGTHGPQVALYDRCLKRWGKLHGFMAFIDTDEFIVLRDGTPNLPTLVRARAGLLQWDVCTAGQRAGGGGGMPVLLRVTPHLLLSASPCEYGSAPVAE